MADDMFGDSALFDEFDKEREPSGSFIIYEKDQEGETDQSKFIFQCSDSSSSEDSDDEEQKVKVQGQSVAHAVGVLQKQNADVNNVQKGAPIVNGDSRSSSGESDCEDDSRDTGPVVSKDRLDKATNYKLNFERNKFKRYCNIIDSTRYIHDEESAGLQIIFQNNKFSRKYKTQIEAFIEALMDAEAAQPVQTMQMIDLKSSVPSCSELNDKIPIERRTDKMYKAHSIIGCSQFYRYFMMDTLGWPLVEYNPSLTDSWDIPAYEQVFTDILPLDEATRKDIVKKKEKERSKPKCWNCDGDHMLMECKLPRNQHKINENKQIFMANSQQQPTGPKPGRYHKEPNDDNRYGKFKPGVISDELREAMGLLQQQLPLYIYRMRALGYPPGWMEDAKSDPGLSMFDKDGKDIDENEEEGALPAGPQLNVNKIIEYPGFTVETPDNIIDECGQYGLPPLQPHQLKSTLMATTQSLEESLKREHEEEEEEQEVKRLKHDTSDMDLDDESNQAANISFNPPLPPETPPSRPPVPDSTPPPTPDENSRNSAPAYSRESSQAPSEGRSDSPSLEELEEKYQLLQKSLLTSDDSMNADDLVVLDSCEDDEDSNMEQGDKSANPINIDSADDNTADESFGETSKNPIEIANDSIDSTIDDFEFIKPRLVKSGSCASIQTFGELGTGSPSSSNPGTPVHSPFIEYKPNFKGSVSKSKDFSTPIMKRALSIESLPSDSKFSQGIEDHIPFENLPDATGNFEKIRNLVSKIRKLKPTFRKKKK